MPSLTPDQQVYINQRLAQIRWWNRLGWLLMVALAGFFGWLWTRHPLYVDPQLLLQRLRNGSVADIEIARLAALGNLAFLGCGLLLACMILLVYAAMWAEATTIRRLTAEPLPPQPVEPPEEDNFRDQPPA
ncbi:hypothetical protein EV700_3174 [Fluviicoccus keumensis]|uniref:Uncharacterized protein n=1 Tax=Fluviicoccus keumensis TaxID=1435465 RepID=A0A4Q7YJZ6_9GAMM|nr:hypothetical protein [Fluviicoccus keumensis]RZU36961.1 hypothetical protein EV700_3174 [Fluviicoccus keumensis]